MDTFEIKTITPVHIGSGRFLQSKIERRTVRFINRIAEMFYPF